MAKKPTTKKSATRAKAPKPPKKQKPDKAEAAKAAVGHNSADPAMRVLFLEDHYPKWSKAKKVLDDAQRGMQRVYKGALADGFTKVHFDMAHQMSTPAGEQKFRETLAQQAAAAMYVGSDVGALLGQLDLFGPSRTDATERAYDEGQKAAMEKGPAHPDYAPGTAQYESFLKGYHDQQAKLTDGFVSTDKGAKTRAEKNRAAKAAGRDKGDEEKPAEPNQPKDQPAEQPSEPPPEAAGQPVSGQRLTRAEFNRLQEQANQSQFSKAN